MANRKRQINRSKLSISRTPPSINLERRRDGVLTWQTGRSPCYRPHESCDGGLIPRDVALEMAEAWARRRLPIAGAGPALAAVVDRRTGRPSDAINMKNVKLQGAFCHPVVRSRAEWVKRNQRHCSFPGTHAEWIALNNALWARDVNPSVGEEVLEEFAIYTLWLKTSASGRMRHGEPCPRCGNCEVLTDGALYVGPRLPEFDDRITLTEAARCWRPGDRPWLLPNLDTSGIVNAEPLGPARR